MTEQEASAPLATSIDTTVPRIEVADSSARAESLRTGLVGAGLMGRGIGLSLLRAGHSLGVVAHRRRETIDELLAAGAWEASDPASLAAGCDVIVTCLPSVEAARDVLLGPNGVTRSRHDARPAGSSPLLVIECSTLMPAVALELGDRLGDASILFVDSPVTRGPDEAVAGRLAALVGGRPEAVDRAAPVLAAFCERQFRCGPAGSGYAAKLINNFLAFSNLVAVGEAMATARRSGLDLPMLLEAISVSGGRNRVLDGLAPLLAGTGPSRSKVTIETAHKDADYYRRWADTLGTAGPQAQGVASRLADALDAGLGAQLTPAYLDFVARQLTSTNASEKDTR